MRDLLEDSEDNSVWGYYGHTATIHPAAQHVLGEQQMAYFANGSSDDQFKNQLQKRIEEYNAKYAGKNQREVDREERDKHNGLVRKTWEELMEPKVVLPKEYTPDPELAHIQLVLTSESTYCGEHNTVDPEGCHVCKGR